MTTGTSLFDKERVNFVRPKINSSDSRAIFSDGLLRTFFLYILLHTFFLYMPESCHLWKSRGLRACPISIIALLFWNLCSALQYTLNTFTPSWSTFPSSSFSLYPSMKLKPTPNDRKTIGYELGVLTLPILIGLKKVSYQTRVPRYQISKIWNRSNCDTTSNLKKGKMGWYSYLFIL